MTDCELKVPLFFCLGRKCARLPKARGSYDACYPIARSVWLEYVLWRCLDGCLVVRWLQTVANESVDSEHAAGYILSVRRFTSSVCLYNLKPEAFGGYLELENALGRTFVAQEEFKSLG